MTGVEYANHCQEPEVLSDDLSYTRFIPVLTPLFYLFFPYHKTAAMNYHANNGLRKKIRMALLLTIAGLIASGLSAIPLKTELNFVLQFREQLPVFLVEWFDKVNLAITETSEKYPLVLYGYDWLGFAHVLIALAFIGPLLDPVKNQWVVIWGMMASALTIAMALVAERFRDIPFFWSLIDAAIGAGAFLILWICNTWINQLKTRR